MTISTTRMALALAIMCTCAVGPLASAQSRTVTYQGELRSAGAAANGIYDMRFQLYDAPVGGLQVSAPTCANNVTVSQGRFTVPLDFTAQVPSGLYRNDLDPWVEIWVRSDLGLDCAAGGSWQVLAPRQRLTKTPLANHALTASALIAPDGLPASAVTVDNAGNVGIGTTTPQGVFDVTHANGKYFRIDSFNNIRMGSPGSTVIQFNYEAQGNALLAFNVAGNNTLNIGTSGVGVSGAADPTDGLAVSGPLTVSGGATFGSGVTIGTTTRYISLHPSAFTPERGSADTGWAPGRFEYRPDGLYSYSNTFNQDVLASVSLPDGCVVTNFIASVVDNGVATNIVAEFGRTNMFTLAANVLATGSSFGNSTGVQIIGGVPAGDFVNNFSYAYWFRVRLQGESGVNYHQLVGVRLTYTVTQPLP